MGLPYEEPQNCQSVVHFAGLLNERISTFLAPTTQVISLTGLHQVVIAIDDERSPRCYDKLHPSVEIVRVSIANRSSLAGWQALTAQFEHVIRQRSLYAVHLHGFRSCLLGGLVLATHRNSVRILYSPHSSKSLGRLRLLGTLLSRSLQTACALLEQTPVANSRSEAQILSKLTKRSAELIEHAVENEFFHAFRNDIGRTALVVTSGEAQTERKVDLFTQLAVLLGREDPPVRFAWIGNAGPSARAKLRAANVRVFKTVDDSERARYLSQASIYIQTLPTDDFPLTVAQAMAVGLPCVVAEGRMHRDVITHGENGFICTNEQEFIERIALLTGSRSERDRIGIAARAEAMRRFTKQHFRESLLRLYGLNESDGFVQSPIADLHSIRFRAGAVNQSDQVKLSTSTQ